MVIWNWCHSARCILCWCGGSMVPVSDWRHNLVTANTGPQLGNMGYSNFGLLGSWHGQITKYNNNNKLACQNTQRFEKYVISFLGSFLALDSFSVIPYRHTPKQLTQVLKNITQLRLFYYLLEKISDYEVRILETDKWPSPPTHWTLGPDTRTQGDTLGTWSPHTVNNDASS